MIEQDRMRKAQSLASGAGGGGNISTGTVMYDPEKLDWFTKMLIQAPGRAWRLLKRCLGFKTAMTAEEMVEAARKRRVRLSTLQRRDREYRTRRISM
jgi:hypothetical protein